MRALNFSLIALTFSLAVLESGVERSIYALAAVILYAATARWTNISNAVVRLNLRLTQHLKQSAEEIAGINQKITNWERSIAQVNASLIAVEDKFSTPIIAQQARASVNRFALLAVIFSIGVVGFSLGILSQANLEDPDVKATLEDTKSETARAALQLRRTKREARLLLARMRRIEAPSKGSYATVILPKPEDLSSDLLTTSSHISLPETSSEPHARWKFSDNLESTDSTVSQSSNLLPTQVWSAGKPGLGRNP